MIVNFSGGKDSTAMLHLLIDQNADIEAVMHFDTGWEFPEALAHVDLVEKRTGIEIIRVRPERPFDWHMYERPVVARKGPLSGSVHRHGYGWPSAFRRWCTRLKVRAMEKAATQLGLKRATRAIGYAFDEIDRAESRTKYEPRYEKVYPLIDAKMKESDCLRFCYDLGYDFFGFYEKFDRMSCYCCPLKAIDEHRTLRKCHPELWSEMLRKESMLEELRGFNHRLNVIDLEKRFAEEDSIS